MNSECQFCKICTQPQNLLYKDQLFFAFHDIDKSTARQHILVCTVQHIETALDIQDTNVLIAMRNVGKLVLDNICEEDMITDRNYRFGFHLPPHNSIDHIHLHCFLLPFTSFAKDRVIYGKMLASVEQVLKKISENSPKL